MRSLLPAILSLLALVSPAIAQNSAPPDLSGTWVLNPAKSKLGKHNTISSETDEGSFTRPTPPGSG